MKISISGRHMTITDALQDYAKEKARKLERYYDLVQDVKVVINNEGDRRLVEMIVSARIGRFVGQMTHEDAYAAIDLLIDKMERQLTKQKEKLKLKKRSGRQRAVTPEEVAPAPAGAEAAAEDDGESYDDIVRKLEL